MPFFIEDQRNALQRLHRNEPQHTELVEFLATTLDRFAAERLAPLAAKRDDVEVFDAGRGYWTRFRLKRNGEMRMPVPVRVSGLTQSKDTVVQGMDRERTVPAN